MVRLAWSLFAWSILVLILGVAIAQDATPGDPLGDDQLRRWAIPERIDPRDYELDVAMVRVVNLAAGVDALSTHIVWDDLVPFVTEEQLDRSQRDWFDPNGVAFGALAFGTASSYMHTPAGEHALVVSAPGAEVGSLETPIALESGGYYTILVSVANDEAANSAGAVLSARVLLDPVRAPTAGMAALRFVHAAGSGAALDVVAWRADKVRALTPPGGPRGMFEPVVEPLDVDDAHLPALSVSVDPDDALVDLQGPAGLELQFYGKATLVSLPPGPYTLTVSRDGYLTTSDTFELEPTEHHAAPFLLSEDDQQAGARLAGPPPPERVTPVWRMPLGDVALRRGVAPGTQTDYISVHAPGYALEVRTTGTLAVLARVPGDALAPGGWYTAFLTPGRASEGALDVVIVRDGGILDVGPAGSVTAPTGGN